MPHLCWTLALDDSTHSIELRHNPWLGRKSILVDGVPVQGVRRGWYRSVHPFRLGDHGCAILIRDRGLRFRYDLVLDGRSLRTGQHPALRTPLELSPAARPEGRGDEVAALHPPARHGVLADGRDGMAAGPPTPSTADPLPPAVVVDLVPIREQEDELGKYRLLQTICIVISLAGALWLFWTALR